MQFHKLRVSFCRVSFTLKESRNQSLAVLNRIVSLGIVVNLGYDLTRLDIFDNILDCLSDLKLPLDEDDLLVVPAVQECLVMIGEDLDILTTEVVRHLVILFEHKW